MTGLPVFAERGNKGRFTAIARIALDLPWAILEVAIGIVFIYAELNMMRATNESHEAFFKSRSTALEFGIRELLHEVGSGQITVDLHNHPEIYRPFAGTCQPTKRTQPP